MPQAHVSGAFTHVHVHMSLYIQEAIGVWARMKKGYAE